MSTKPALPLDDMHTRHDGLTKAIADCYTEAARVCLDRHHAPPEEIQIKSDGTAHAAIANWEPTDDQTKGAWANTDDATRDGAYAFALAAAEITEGLVAVHRAETRTGADYYVAPKGKTIDDLEECLRLEVSGVDRGAESAVAQRLNAKLKQAAAGASNLPAMAGVVGFKAAVVLLAPLEE
jgi:hypothetical protein